MNVVCDVFMNFHDKTNEPKNLQGRLQKCIIT